jgi:dTDP-4-amino-4,6-dideoxygalactose transaminase
MVPKSRPYLSIQELLAAVKPSAGRTQFEAAMARMTGARYGVAFSFAHSGFYALLQALSLTQAEIVLPAYTCDIMAEVILRTGNIPVFVDIDLADFNMDLDVLRTAITSKTRAIVATHMFGYPAHINAIRQLADSEQITIIEDSALSLTGSTRLQGDIALFSFGPDKPLYTVRGGVCVTNDTNLYERLRAYRDQHMNQLPFKEWAKRWARLMVTYFSQSDTTYDLALRLGLLDKGLGRSATCIPNSYATAYADFQARVGMVLLDKADMLLAKRQTIVALYERRLKGIPGFIPAPIIEGATFSHYTARARNRDALQFSQKMYQRSIQTGRTFDYAVTCLDQYRPYVQHRCPHAEQAAQEVVNLPIHVNLSESQVDFVADNIRQVLG